MLPRSQRLSQSRAIVSVMKRGHTVMHDALRFRFFQSTRPTTKIAVVVSLRVSKRAVIRNRVKRQLHAILGPLVRTFRYPIDGVFSVQPGLEQRTFQELSKIVDVILRRAQLISRQ